MNFSNWKVYVDPKIANGKSLLMPFKGTSSISPESYVIKQDGRKSSTKWKLLVGFVETSSRKMISRRVILLTKSASLLNLAGGNSIAACITRQQPILKRLLHFFEQKHANAKII